MQESQVHLEVTALPRARARARGRVARGRAARTKERAPRARIKPVSCILVSVVVTIIDTAYCTYM